MEASLTGAQERSRSPVEQRAVGKALRERVPRAAHAEFKLASRRDPIAILRESDANRLRELVPIRYGRMLASPFAFYRGAAAIMAADLAQTTSTGVIVQACGDCHLKNFGGFATPERNIVFDINDFDETLPAPWEWDVKRLAASFVLAVRENGLSKQAAKGITLACVRAYRTAIREFANADPLEIWYAKLKSDDLLTLLPVGERARVARRVEKVAAKRGSDIDYPRLAEITHGEIRIKESPPLIFHPEVARTPEFASSVEQILNGYRESLSDERRLLLDRYRFVDAAIKVVGIGSVGTRCWIVLLMSHANEPLFLQFKQANASVLEPYAEASAYSHHGQRVVVGQRLMQAASDIFLGWTTGPNGDFYVRQLRDAKISPRIETFDDYLFEAHARACGWNLARAHAKTGNASTLGAYLGKSESFDEAIAEFSVAYADQAERDYATLKSAIKSGTIEAYTEQ